MAALSSGRHRSGWLLPLLWLAVMLSALSVVFVSHDRSLASHFHHQLALGGTP